MAGGLIEEIRWKGEMLYECVEVETLNPCYCNQFSRGRINIVDVEPLKSLCCGSAAYSLAKGMKTLLLRACMMRIDYPSDEGM